jgi:hypothetical protein
MIMKAKSNKTSLPDRQGGLPKRRASFPHRQKGSVEKNDLLGYPEYPAGEDIYSKYQEEKDINPEDISKTKESDYISGRNDEKDFNADVSGSDLDVPGAELDDNQEDIGSEDEENNYYSLGGDDHNELEEDKGD